MEERGQLPAPSPFGRIILFLILAVLTGIGGSAIGALMGLAWISLAYGELLEPHIIPSNLRFAILTASISASYPPLALLTFAFMRREKGYSLESFGLVQKGWLRDLSCGFALGAVFVGLMFGFYAVMGLVKFEFIPEIPLKHWLAMSFWLCPLIGLTEELIFRGYLLSVVERWKGQRFAVAFTTVLFWLSHLGQGNVHEVLGAAGTLIIGITLAFARYLSGGLWLPIGLHAGYDWMALSFGGDINLGFPALTRFHPNVPHWVIGPPGHVGALDLAFYAALLFSILLLLPKFRRKENSYLETTRN